MRDAGRWESKHPAKRAGSGLLHSLVPLQFNPSLPWLRWTEHPHSQIGGVKRVLWTFFSPALLGQELRAPCNQQSGGGLRLQAGSSL